ncbi:MAG: Na+/H+ antiporter subunit E [Casimicrobiaceae bacterium]
MRTLFPTPIMSALIFAVWLAANQSLSAGHLLIALALAIGVPLATLPFRPQRARIKNWGTVIRLGLTVLWDIVLSNIQLARLILGPEARLRPTFLWIPLDARDEHAIIALAGIITMTPGTLSCDVTDDRSHLLVHAFSTDDPAVLMATIKARYEQPLREIFE